MLPQRTHEPYKDVTNMAFAHSSQNSDIKQEPKTTSTTLDTVDEAKPSASFGVLPNGQALQSQRGGRRPRRRSRRQRQWSHPPLDVNGM